MEGLRSASQPLPRVGRTRRGSPAPANHRGCDVVTVRAPHERVEWPLNRFDVLLVAQTYPGRPMTTHHTLELDRPPTLDRWVRALEQLVDDYPELSSRRIAPRSVLE